MTVRHTPPNNCYPPNRSTSGPPHPQKVEGSSDGYNSHSMPMSTAWTNRNGRQRGLPKRLRQHILQRDNHTCHCGQPATQIDHITPVAEHGTDHPHNLQAICTNCHNTKTKAEAARGRARHSTRRPPNPHPGLHPGA